MNQGVKRMKDDFRAEMDVLALLPPRATRILPVAVRGMRGPARGTPASLTTLAWPPHPSGLMIGREKGWIDLNQRQSKFIS